MYTQGSSGQLFFFRKSCPGCRWLALPCLAFLPRYQVVVETCITKKTAFCPFLKHDCVCFWRLGKWARLKDGPFPKFTIPHYENCYHESSLLATLAVVHGLIVSHNLMVPAYYDQITTVWPNLGVNNRLFHLSLYIIQIHMRCHLFWVSCVEVSKCCVLHFLLCVTSTPTVTWCHFLHHQASSPVLCSKLRFPSVLCMHAMRFFFLLSTCWPVHQRSMMGSILIQV